MTTLPEFQKRAWQIAEDHGFHAVSESPLEKLALITSEVGEAIEECRIPGAKLDFPYIDERGKPIGLWSELADIVIRTLDMAQIVGIDLENAVAQKMDYNEMRPFLHGKTI